MQTQAGIELETLQPQDQCDIATLVCMHAFIVRLKLILLEWELLFGWAIQI